MSRRFRESLNFPLVFVGIMWVIHLLKSVLDLNLVQFGVYPRVTQGIKGIFFSPLIHSDWHHLLSNSVPFVVLSVMIFFFYRRVAIRSYILIYILTGLAVWLFGRRVFHIGASGVVYGLLAFVFWSGIFRRSLKSIVLALIVTFLYSGYFLGVLPNQEGISWESHLLGALAGIFTAFWYKNEIEADEIPKKPSWADEEPDPPRYFLERDVFDRKRGEQEM
ncbi:MAG: rhomboid family intramembrane serine protease [Bacteroidetes bacterium]|nr:rhomboid family intramembrane serine protease [Bacteroidota bacterium]